MIKFRNSILENYSIDPITAVITNSKGEVQKTSIHKDGRPYFKCMVIHEIQAHTKYGYKKGFVIHHIDHNKMNNALSNLVYLTRSEHAKIHGKNMSEETKQKLSKSHKGKTSSNKGKRYKWINNRVEEKYIPLNEYIPEGFIRGRLKRKIS